MLGLLLCETSLNTYGSLTPPWERASTWRALLWDFSALKGMGTLGPDCWGWAGARVLETTVTAACPWPVCLLVTFPFEKTPDPEAGQNLQPTPNPRTPRNASRLASLGTPLVSQAPLVCGLLSYKAEEVSALLWSPC